MPESPPSIDKLRRRLVRTLPAVQIPDGRAKTSERGYGWKWQQFTAWYKTQHWRCATCKKWIRNGKDGHVDHVIPLSHGGSHCDPDNSQLLCHACHTRKTKAEQRGQQGRGGRIPTTLTP